MPEAHLLNALPDEQLATLLGMALADVRLIPGTEATAVQHEYAVAGSIANPYDEGETRRVMIGAILDLAAVISEHIVPDAAE